MSIDKITSRDQNRISCRPSSCRNWRGSVIWKSESLFQSKTWVGNLQALHRCHHHYYLKLTHKLCRLTTVHSLVPLVHRWLRLLIGLRVRSLAPVDLDDDPQELPPPCQLKHTGQSWFCWGQGAPDRSDYYRRALQALLALYCSEPYFILQLKYFLE